MAEFSKQYCKIEDMGFDGDFDVYEEWSQLQPDTATVIICEGFGFSAIGRKQENDTVWVLKEDGWVDFDEMCLKAKQ